MSVSNLKFEVIKIMIVKASAGVGKMGVTIFFGRLKFSRSFIKGKVGGNGTVLE
jgi:hypothetical protein